MRRVLAAAAATGDCPECRPELRPGKLTVWWVKGFYKSEDDALYAAIKKYEAKTGVKVELSQYAVQDMISKSVAALDAGTPPDIAYSDTYDVQVAGQMGVRRKLEDISDVIEPMKPASLPTRWRRLSLQRQGQEEAYYAFRSSSRRCTSSTGRTCWARPASGKRHSRHLEGILVVLVRQGPAGHPQGDRPAHLRYRQPDGRRIDRLVPVVPELGRRLQRQAGRRFGQGFGRRSQGQERAWSTHSRDYTDVYDEGSHSHSLLPLHQHLNPCMPWLVERWRRAKPSPNL